MQTPARSPGESEQTNASSRSTLVRHTSRQSEPEIARNVQPRQVQSRVMTDPLGFALGPPPNSSESAMSDVRHSIPFHA